MKFGTLRILMLVFCLALFTGSGYAGPPDQKTQTVKVFEVPCFNVETIKTVDAFVAYVPSVSVLAAINPAPNVFYTDALNSENKAPIDIVRRKRNESPHLYYKDFYLTQWHSVKPHYSFAFGLRC